MTLRQAFHKAIGASAELIFVLQAAALKAKRRWQDPFFRSIGGGWSWMSPKPSRMLAPSLRMQLTACRYCCCQFSPTILCITHTLSTPAVTWAALPACYLLMHLPRRLLACSCTHQQLKADMYQHTKHHRLQLRHCAAAMPVMTMHSCEQ